VEVMSLAEGRTVSPFIVVDACPAAPTAVTVDASVGAFVRPLGVSGDTDVGFETIWLTAPAAAEAVPAALSWAGDNAPNDARAPTSVRATAIATQ
jgi:hypothetical protein